MESGAANNVKKRGGSAAVSLTGSLPWQSVDCDEINVTQATGSRDAKKERAAPDSIYILSAEEKETLRVNGGGQEGDFRKVFS